MEQSTETAALFEALAKAQGEISNAPFDRENPHFKARYATQASLRDVSREALSRHGLAVIQSTINGDPGWAGVETMLCHASGQWVRSCLLLPTTKADAQGYGSAITYARRYAFSAILGLAAEEDDDGTAASQPQPQQRRQGESRGDTRSTAPRSETPATAELNTSQRCLEFVPAGQRGDKAEVRRILEGAYGGSLPPWKEMTEELWAETLRCLQGQEKDPFQDAAESGG